MDIDSIMTILPRTLLLGSILSLAVLGFSFSLRVLGYADLTLEGSFVLGTVTGAIAIQYGMNPLWAIPLALLAGALAGAMTAGQHCFLRVNKLLSGIISWAILYSLNLRLMGSPNYSFYGQQTLFTIIPSPAGVYIMGFAVAVVVFVITDYLLSTELGLFLRAYGENSALTARSG